MPNDNIVFLEDVRIIFRNFSGKESQYNREGDRNFGVIIPDSATAEAMLADGWNVKYLKPRDADEGEEIEETPWLSVSVNFDKGRPPKVMRVLPQKKKMVKMDVHDVELLDWADIVTVDLVVRPYQWEVNGRTGIKAYLQDMYVTLEDNPLEAKYAHMSADGDLEDEA